MSNLRFFSRLLLLSLFFAACSASSERGKAAVQFYIHPESLRPQDVKASEYLRRHLQRRSDSPVVTLSPSAGTEVSVHVSEDLGGDYKVEYTPQGGYRLAARDERTMIWLSYQFIKYIGRKNKNIVVDDLPPCVFPSHDTLATFPFEYRDLHMPANQHPDMTYLLGLHNLEIDWGIWGHRLSLVLGTNGDSFYGYEHMDSELFARSDGMVYENQFCFSSDLLLDLTSKYIMDQFGNGHRDSYCITIGPNDNSIVCNCRRCQARGNTRTSATPALVHFVRQLSARFPGHRFFIPAYSTTAALPSGRLPENVGVFLSAIDYPRTWNGQGSETFLKKIDEWKEVTSTVYIWDYVCNFDDYLSPYPILYVMQQRFQEYVKRGVKGIFLNGSGYFYSCLQEAYSFVLSALLANPDADVKELVREYFSDAMPNVGQFFASVMLAMEDHAAASGKELPLYGGMEEALESYLFEKEFRAHYDAFLKLDGVQMTHRERVIYDKTRQIVSFTFLEMSRLKGLGEGGYLDEDMNVKPEVWNALHYLGRMTSEDDMAILTNNENASVDHMDRVNESGVYLADYENEVGLWLTSQWWKGDVLLGKTLTVRHAGGSVVTQRLTDGVCGVAQNYHWGWQIYPQKDLVIELPPENLHEAGGISLAFLNYERHQMAPPKTVELWVDGKYYSSVRREGLSDYFDEGEKVIFRSHVSLPRNVSKVELRFTPSGTRYLALDEIYMRK